MKTIFENLLKGKDLINNKKLLLAATFVSAIINCDAIKQELNNVSEAEDQRLLYRIQKVVAGDEYVKANCKSKDFDILAEIIRIGWQGRRHSLFRWGRFSDERNNVNAHVVSVLTGLASWGFRTQQPIQTNLIKDAIKIILPNLWWKEKDKVFSKVMYYLFDESVDGAFWIKSISTYENAKCKTEIVETLQDDFNERGIWYEYVYGDKLNNSWLNFIHKHLEGYQGFINFQFASNIRERSAITINDNSSIVTKMNKNDRLENFYLFHVLKYLETNQDCINFRSINKKCNNAISSLKCHPLPLSGPQAEFVFLGSKTMFLKTLERKIIEGYNYVIIYGVSYDEYVKLDRNNDCIHGRPVHSYLKYDIIICNLKQYRQEKAYLDTIEDIEGYYRVKNAMEQFRISLDWNEWSRLPEEEQNELTNEKGKSIRDVMVNYTTISPYDMRNLVLRVPLGVTRIAFGDVSKQMKYVSRIILPASLNRVSADGFSPLERLTEIAFRTTGITFEGHFSFSGCDRFKRICFAWDLSKEDIALFRQKLGAAGLPSRITTGRIYDID